MKPPVLTIELTVLCSYCGSKLEAKIAEGGNIRVDPCDKCLREYGQERWVEAGKETKP